MSFRHENSPRFRGFPIFVFASDVVIFLLHYKLLDDIFHRNLLTHETLFRPCIEELYGVSSLQPSCDLLN